MARGLHLTIDEWFYYHFNHEELLPVTTKLFFNIFEVCDKIVLQRGTPLAKKFHELVETSILYPPKQRQAVQALLRLFLQNSNKVHWIDNDLVLDESIELQLPRHDVYLVKMCLQTTDKVFITTDRKLYDAVKSLEQILGIRIFMTDEFIQNYPNF
ncbi:MAG TPA: hypothetical protein PLW32_05860 [Chitinophagaceae bacterium]|jgi:hypothetical protein|nr:hypothetical protein [Chitinophagaceae bacterium]MBP9739414.1 hypothetical protein [Chitinophagaceae bacterium]HPH23387.1 hypothetical protein [Chitinophagaceae bacterium]